MRGLDIRIAYAKAKVLSITDQPRSEDDIFEACRLAEELGYADSRSDMYGDVPILFADEPALKRAWVAGQKDWFRESEMSDCPCCNSESGFCSWH